MATVWVVEEGEYSDYHVVGVFTSKENAERIAQLAGGEVAEWTLDPCVDELNAGLWPYFVTMSRDGTTERIERRDSVSSYSIGNGLEIWKRKRAPAYRNNPNIQDAVSGDVWAESEEHAVKIANEYRTKCIATGEL